MTAFSQNEVTLTRKAERDIEREVDRQFEQYRRGLCKDHAAAVEETPLPLLVVMDDRFGAGYQLALIHAAQRLREMGARNG